MSDERSTRMAPVASGDLFGQSESSETSGRPWEAAATGFVHRMAALFRACLAMSTNPRAAEPYLAPFCEAASELAQVLGLPVSLVPAGQTVVVSGTALRFHPQMAASSAFLQKMFERLQIHQVVLHGPMDTTLARDLVEDLFESYRVRDPWEILADIGPYLTFTRREVQPAAAREHRPGQQRKTLRLFGAGLVRAEAATQAIRKGEREPPVEIKRWVMEAIDAMDHDSRLLLALTRSPGLRPGLPAHIVNTTVLSLAMGRVLSYERPALVELGMSAMLHAVGEGMRSRAGWLCANLDPSERQLLRAPEPLHNAFRLLELGFLTDRALRRAVVAFEVGMRHDRLPDAELDAAPSLVAHPFSRIIAVARAYDLMTIARTPRRALLPDEALAVVRVEAGRHYDPAAVHAFVLAVGLYPIGSAVRLDTGELAVVVDVPATPSQLLQPMIRLVGGMGGDFGRRIDLGDQPPGEPTRHIQHAIDPAVQGINPIHYFLE